MYYVYVICNTDGMMYVGYSADLKKRVTQHNSGKNKSTRSQRWKFPPLIYYEAYLGKADAIRRERSLKQRGQAKRYLKERIHNSLQIGSAELGARLKAPSRREGR